MTAEAPCLATVVVLANTIPFRNMFSSIYNHDGPLFRYWCDRVCCNRSNDAQEYVARFLDASFAIGLLRHIGYFGWLIARYLTHYRFLLNSSSTAVLESVQADILKRLAYCLPILASFEQYESYSVICIDWDILCNDIKRWNDSYGEINHQLLVNSSPKEIVCERRHRLHGY